MATDALPETALYAPIKAYLESQGYEVKAEVCGADVVAARGEESPVIVELKTCFSLALFHQAVERLSLSDAVYVAVPRKPGRAFQRGLSVNTKLCRRLGLGLLTVRLRDGHVEPHIDPGPYRPRGSPTKRGRLLREFTRRVGDPNRGGSRGTIVTAYRQDAVRCATHLASHGASKGSAVAKATGVTRATTIMRDDHYGWFERVRTGVYQLTPRGEEALPQWQDD
ncbi:MAG: DUF2161 domain-containing phosphodiesterase [Myxococcota bacterium]